MEKELTVYQKPTCTKCRTTLRLLKERGAEFEAINYFETPLTEADLRALLKKLGLSAREILRRDEPVSKELGIGKKEFSDEELIAVMTKHPDLITINWMNPLNRVLVTQRTLGVPGFGDLNGIRKPIV